MFINHPALLESVLATNARRFTRSKSKPPTRLDYFLAGGEDVYRVINFPGDEDFWVRERHRFNPSLKGSALARYGPTMVTMAERHASTWRDGEVREVHREMLRITLDIVLNALYGVDFPGDREHILDTCETIVRDITHRATHPFQAPPIIPTRENRVLRQAVADGRKLVERIIREHPEVHAEGGDLIDVLGRAGEHEPGLLENPEWQYQIIALLIAGHETTAVALTWTWYLAGPAPVHRGTALCRGGCRTRRPPAEQDGHCGAALVRRGVQGGAAPLSPGADHSAHGVRGVHAWRLSGSAGHGAPDLRLGDPPRRPLLRRRRTLPAGALAKRPPEPRRYTYLPFSGGPRTCIGASFATAEAILAIARIAQQYRLELTAGEEPRPAPWVGLRPHNGMPMQVADRGRPVRAAHRDSEQRATGPA